MNFKCTGISKCAQHLCILHDVLNRSPVVALVKKIPGLLSIFKVYMKTQTIFIDDDFGIKRCRKKTFLLRQSFQFTHRYVVAFINTFWPEYFFNCLYKSRFPFIYSQCECLYNKIIVELIDDELRQSVGFANYQPAKIGRASC